MIINEDEEEGEGEVIEVLVEVREPRRTIEEQLTQLKHFLCKNKQRPLVTWVLIIIFVLVVVTMVLSFENDQSCDKLLDVDSAMNRIRGDIFSTPLNFTVAFIADVGSGEGMISVYNLIKREGSHMVLHQGGFDYQTDPELFDSSINTFFGSSFPYLVSIGETELQQWKTVPGYQDYLASRLRRVDNMTCSGKIGVSYWCMYNGLFISFSGVGTICPSVATPTGLSASFKNSGVGTRARWRVCSWHKNQKLMQVGKNGRDETGWDPYEGCRANGALIVTGHSRTYSRSYLLSDTKQQKIDSTESPYQLKPGKTVVVVNGLGGFSADEADPYLASLPHWASVLSKHDTNTPTTTTTTTTTTTGTGSTGNTNSNTFGAFFCKYNVNNEDPPLQRAHCYFKDTQGTVKDFFELIQDDNS